MPRYLTKSRYKLALECPRKLYYNDHSDIYENTKQNNDFLRALAEGGFQVGALAQLYHEGGTEITSLKHQEALDETALLLEQEQVIIYEAALAYGPFFVRVDVLIKDGTHIDLIEVKAKSFNRDEESFYDKKLLKKGQKRLVSSWRPYLFDVAFQTMVAQKSHPQWQVSPYLMLADKEARASVDGLNQKFLIAKENGRPKILISSQLKASDLGTPLLTKVDVKEPVELILSGQDAGGASFEAEGLPSFYDQAVALGKSYQNDEKLAPVLSKVCRGCEFRCGSDCGKKSGFNECWRAKLGTSKITEPLVLDLWAYLKVDDLIASGVYYLSDVSESDLKIKENDKKSGLSRSERQWLQVSYAKDQNRPVYFDYDVLQEAMDSWRYPLHFIDFETTMVAIPFHKGRLPYEQIAFQFSHHSAAKDGSVKHAGQFISTVPGVFPNFDFVRALKKELEHDNGTIFRYATHENSVLNQIIIQLGESTEADRYELIDWIKTITKSKEKAEDAWEGKRTMVDLCDLVKRAYYHPHMQGSNSIKKVLPAIIKHSDYLRKKYSSGTYGKEGGIESLNFRGQRWLLEDGTDKGLDPYKQLPVIEESGSADGLFDGEGIAEGGAAMTAWSRMQFTQMSEQERAGLAEALLKYCELDTLAMVMIYEYWREEIEKNRQRRVA